MAQGNKNGDLVALTEAAHRKLHIQARNLLFEYRNSVNNEDLRLKRGYVPCEIVEKLMRLYGELIAREIYASMRPKPQKKEIQGKPFNPNPNGKKCEKCSGTEFLPSEGQATADGKITFKLCCAACGWYWKHKTIPC